MIDAALQKLVSEIIGKDDYSRIKLSLSNEGTELRVRMGALELSKGSCKKCSKLSNWCKGCNQQH